MTTNALCIDPERVAHALREEAVEQLTGAELVLDFSAVHRVDANAIQALEELAALAEQRSVKTTLRGVNMDIYKVLKLMKLAGRFDFAN